MNVLSFLVVISEPSLIHGHSSPLIVFLYETFINVLFFIPSFLYFICKENIHQPIMIIGTPSYLLFINDMFKIFPYCITLNCEVIEKSKASAWIRIANFNIFSSWMPTLHYIIFKENDFLTLSRKFSYQHPKYIALSFTL